MTRQRNPLPAVDIIVETGGGIVLVRRKNPPLGWALPGGFIEYGETVECAAVREAREETGLEVGLVRLLGVYSKPNRDPRFHTLSVVYIAAAEGEVCGGNDAAEARIFHPENLPEAVVFDHREIIRDYLNFKESGELPPPRL